MRVRRTGRYLGHFDCSRCITFNKLQHKSISGALSAEEEQQLRHCSHHRTIANSQRIHYQQMRASLRPRQLLVLMDFTSVFLTPKIGHQQQASVVQDCIVVLEFINENGARVRQNFDFLCDSQETNTNDYHFVLHVWISLFRFKHLFDHFDSVDIWTDGGPHHFKTRFCQWMWHWFSTQRFGNKRISLFSPLITVIPSPTPMPRPSSEFFVPNIISRSFNASVPSSPKFIGVLPVRFNSENFFRNAPRQSIA
jgi:hypothetical protein